MRLFHGVLILVLVLAACAHMKRRLEIVREPRAASTFGKFLKLAKAGDATSQNLVGFMLYFGELTSKNRYAAHRFFHDAADQGNAIAQLNVAIMHYLGAGVPKDLEEAERYFHLAEENNPQPIGSSSGYKVPDSLAELADRAVMRAHNHDTIGESTYSTYCAGCHGLNGIAVYVGSPSFALAERLEKSDAELLRTITEGHEVMPTWGNKLSRQELIHALRFVRTLPLQYQNGIAQILRTPPSLYFFFGPMSSDPTGYRQDYPY